MLVVVGIWIARVGVMSGANPEVPNQSRVRATAAQRRVLGRRPLPSPWSSITLLILPTRRWVLGARGFNQSGELSLPQTCTAGRSNTDRTPSDSSGPCMIRKLEPGTNGEVRKTIQLDSAFPQPHGGNSIIVGNVPLSPPHPTPAASAHGKEGSRRRHAMSSQRDSFVGCTPNAAHV
ncbi:hypothetical protein K505DRAFT_164966 [Melanomma pulvis-pyrius CBS 109.77]|uniref:Uncharacterized protein n=1 Tax=Melanomma pulvis-pyrius CBS 109.77 TaxID=1314802 RepID=A0A6A6WP99_9PLEO|nr:hypothetical protein K505DRAFT_164966 [Melanomma pulvis-pyrius CBS 109.77]